jgi:hypothetical protein
LVPLVSHGQSPRKRYVASGGPFIIRRLISVISCAIPDSTYHQNHQQSHQPNSKPCPLKSPYPGYHTPRNPKRLDPLQTYRLETSSSASTEHPTNSLPVTPTSSNYSACSRFPRGSSRADRWRIMIQALGRIFLLGLRVHGRMRDRRGGRRWI